MVRRTAFEASMEKRKHVRECEDNGMVADSMEVRKMIIGRVMSGEITHDQANAELAKIKKDAKKNGLITREVAFRRG